MIEGKLLAALTAVVRLRSFHAAAQYLGITQSAVTQRIQALEEQIGRPLVVRARDGELTASGEHILRYAEQVEALEADALADVGSMQDAKWARVAISVNADSLATWFQSALSLLLRHHRTALELEVCDQSLTINALRAGAVLACVSSWPEAIQGCSCEPLGKMVYRCVASRQSLEKIATRKLDRKLVMSLPAVNYGRNDAILGEYIKTVVGVGPHEYPCHVVPSTPALLAFVEAGFGFSLVPALQVDRAIRQRTLVDLNPQRTHDIALYWHRWKISTKLLDKLTEYVHLSARRRLVPLESNTRK